MKKAEIILLTLVLTILGVTGLTTTANASSEIPAWIKGVADFWVKGNISDQEFLDAIRFLIEKGVLKIELLESLEEQVRELENDIAIILLQNQEALEEQPTLREDKLDVNPITLIAKQHDRVYLQDSYRFTIRVYDAQENPTGNFYQNWGYLSAVNVTATLFNSDGEVVRSFDGSTGNLGYFSDGFIVPTNFRVGTYTTQITVEKDDVQDHKELIFHILYRPVEGTSN